MFFYICSTCFLRFTGQHMYSTSIKDLDTAHDDPAFVLPGADINVRNRAGQKALHIAKSSLGSPSWNVTGALCWKHVETIGFSIRKRWKNGDWTNINMVSWEYQINESASRHVFSLIVFPHKSKLGRGCCCRGVSSSKSSRTAFHVRCSAVLGAVLGAVRWRGEVMGKITQKSGEVQYSTKMCIDYHIYILILSYFARLFS